jgi:hypothetical protein
LNGRGIVFSAPASGGKTTITRFVRDGRLLSDEFNLIRPKSGGWSVCGTPFGGDRRPTRAEAELSEINLIVKDVRTYATDISAPDAVVGLMKNEYLCMIMGRDAKKMLWRILENVSHAAVRTKCRELHFTLSKDFIRHLEP